MNYFSTLCKLEEKIESCYILLAKEELNGKYDSMEYNFYFKTILEYMNEEKKFFARLDRDELIDIYHKLEKNMVNQTSSIKLLGYSKNVYYERIFDILSSLLGDDMFIYAHTLYYDIHQIIFLFLNSLIHNELYNDVREYLIFYKYHLVFTNSSTEYNFFVTNDVDSLQLEAPSYRTSEFLSYRFVDQSILVLEGNQYLTNIISYPNDFQDDLSSYASVLIQILNILARLTLCDESTLPLIYYELMALLENEFTNENIKNLIREQLFLLESLKEKIMGSR